MRVSSTVGALEGMFGAKFHHFTSAERKVVLTFSLCLACVTTQTRLTRSAEYTLPKELAPFVELVVGVGDFPMVSRHSAVVALSSKRQRGSFLLLVCSQ